MQNIIPIPTSLPQSKEIDYIIAKKKGYDKICVLLYSLGSVCTYDQFRRLYKKLYPKISDSYLKKKVSNVITEMELIKLIESDNINNYKFLYLKKFAFIFITGDYTKYSKKNMRVLLKDKNFKTNLMRVEYYLTNSEIISLNNLDNNLLYLTKRILAIRQKDSNLPYDIDLLNKIIQNNGINTCYDEILNLPDTNLLKIIWIDIYNIYNSLRLQNQTISANPHILKLYKKDSLLTLHYAPTIIIFDVFDSKYYVKKVKELFNKYFNIVTNHTRNMRKSYQENGTLGWEGYNHFAYTFKIIGYNKLELKNKKEVIDKYIINNPNGIILDNCVIEYIDISKYFLHSSQKNEVFDIIDSKFDDLLSAKFK